MEKPKARFQAELIVSFELPGVGWESHGSHSGSQSQLERRGYDESWTLRVNAANAEETSKTLRLVADEIDRVRLQK